MSGQRYYRETPRRGEPLVRAVKASVIHAGYVLVDEGGEATPIVVATVADDNHPLGPDAAIGIVFEDDTVAEFAWNDTVHEIWHEDVGRVSVEDRLRVAPVRRIRRVPFADSAWTSGF